METTLSKWSIDPTHSEVHFKVKHLVIATVTGSFEKFEGTLTAPSADFSNAEVQFSADTESINTNQPDRDGHLKSPDFFDAANHPKLTFKSVSFEKISDDAYKVSGNLSIKGITKLVTLNASFGGSIVDPWGNLKAGFELSGKLSRKEFGLLWNAATETGGLVVADEVKLALNIELVKMN